MENDLAKQYANNKKNIIIFDLLQGKAILWHPVVLFMVMLWVIRESWELYKDYDALFGNREQYHEPEPEPMINHTVQTNNVQAAKPYL